MADQVLVTGGTGYIGSHTVVELQQQGYEVVIIDNLSNSRIEVLDGIQKITGIRPIFKELDLCDKRAVSNFFQEFTDIRAIVHFAASKAVGESVENPLKYYHNNILSLIHLLEEMRKNDIHNIVFSSSCTIYGQPDVLPVTEEATIQEAMSPYGNTKQINEEILQDTIHSNKNIHCISLRYFNPIGAHKSANIGELPLGVPDNLIPFVTQTAIGIRDELKVFGDDYNTPDGSCIRDYIHVVDLAQAHVIAIDRLLRRKNKNNYEYFNLGTGKGSSVLEVVNTFEKVTGEKLKYKIVDRRPGDIEQIWADTTFANNELGWKTELSLADALSSAWEWEKRFRANN